MDADKDRAKSIFLTAAQIASPGEREAYIAAQCGADEPLGREVAELLRHHALAGSFLESPAPGLPPEAAATLDAASIAERPGTVIGPYKLLQQIGEGGMGTVFMAEQTHPVQRKVALKVIKPGMDSRQVIARFEAERQALAMMDHVNIARVFDAGATESGRPYFVMELVKGIPITKFCDQEKLGLRERMELFVPVCQAVQHAHQKGIIHRDLKPSNVLIALYDGKAVPKVIDFGVAKATGASLTDATLHTQLGQMVGTLEYMAPEQAELNNLDIDTRADIYSLGVILYELMTGAPPFSGKELMKAGYAQMLKMIREQEPEKPSTRLSHSDTLPSIAAARKLEPARLTRLLHNEPDWIVMKCLEKERARRYDTANALALDIGRYLNDEPVLAGPVSRVYRVRKFVRRNKGPVAAGVALAALLVLGTVGTSIGLVWALRAERAATLDRDRATTAEKVATDLLVEVTKEKERATVAETQAIAEKDRANEEAAIAQAVSDFLQNDLLAEAAPEKNPRNEKVTVEELLGRAAEKITGHFEDQPLVEAAIRQTLGDTYRSLGNYPAGQPHMERALELRRRLLGEDHPDSLRSMSGLAGLYVAQGKYANAQPLYEKALEVGRRILGEEHPDTLIFMSNLASLYDYQGQYAKAEPLYEKSLEVGRRVLGVEHAYTLIAMNDLAGVYMSRGRYAEAEPLFEEALEVRRRVLGEEHPNTLSSMNSLALLYLSQGEHAKAEPLYLKAIEGRRRVLGDEHPYTLSSMYNLANLYMQQRQYAKAEPLCKAALETRRRTLGEEHPHTLSSMNSLAGLYDAQGRYSEAEPLFVKVLEVRGRVLGEEHPHSLVSMSNLAGLYKDQGRYAEAEPLYVKALEVHRRILGEEHPSSVTSMHNLAHLYSDQDRYAEAEPLLLAAYEVLNKREAPTTADHESRIETLKELVQLYDAWGKPEQAQEWRKKLDAHREAEKKTD